MAAKENHPICNVASLKISPYFAVLRTENTAIFLGEDQHYIFEGSRYIRMIDWIGNDIRRNQSEWESVDRDASEVIAVAEELANNGVLRPPSQLADHLTSFWDSLNSKPAAGEVAIKHFDSGCSGLLEYAVGTNNLTVKPDAEFLIVATNDYLRPEVVELSTRPQPWILAKTIGHTIWIGPLLVPGKTVCWSCLGAALRQNRWVQAAVCGSRPTDYLPHPSTAALPSTIAIAVGMLSTVVAVYLSLGQHSDLEDTILSLDTRSMQFARNHITRRMDCPDCGKGRNSSTLPPVLQEFVSPITGIISQLQVTDASAAAVFHASAHYIHPLCLNNERPSLRPLQALGKGFTAFEAQNGCIAEGIERYSITFQGTEPLQRYRLSEIDGILPTELLLFSDVQYENRETWNKQHSQLQWIPERLQPNSEIAWVCAKSFSDGSMKFVPAGLCYMHYPFTEEPRFCSPDTNGCAAGRNVTEAMLNALLELIERDAVAIWWYNRLNRPRVEFESFADSRFLEIQAAFANEGCDVYLLDVTADTQIPTYVAVSPACDGSKPYFACASHVSARAAGLKALSEVAQVWFWAQRGAAADDLQDWLNKANINGYTYLKGTGKTIARTELPLTTEDALQMCVSRVRSIGIEPHYIDLTRPEIGIPVIRALAPGLRHFWARFAPGRLYDVPVQMGWLSWAKQESDLNPVACMI